ncbi:hypothetical protein BJX65DRAFT_301960 [Aspergillus insuetus]
MIVFRAPCWARDAPHGPEYLFCAKCAHLYAKLLPHFTAKGAKRLDCPTLQTYPIALRIRLAFAENDAAAAHIYDLSQQLANVIHPLAWDMFGAEVPTVIVQEFRTNYVDIRVLLDFPRYFTAVEDPFVKRLLKQAARFMPDVKDAGDDKRWKAEFPSKGQCAAHFRLEFWEQHHLEAMRSG